MEALMQSGNRAAAPPRGFSFVELMVVITIIVILIAMAIPIYQKTIIRSKEDRPAEQPVHAAHGDRQLHLR